MGWICTVFFIVAYLVPDAFAMPEIRELIASYMHAVFLLQMFLFFTPADEIAPFAYREAKKGWKLVRIWADATEEEAKRARKGSRKADRLPFQVQPNDLTTRGGQKSNAATRSRLWPPMFRSLRRLVLRNVHYTARSLILDFGKCFLDVSAPVWRRPVG